MKRDFDQDLLNSDIKWIGLLIVTCLYNIGGFLALVLCESLHAEKSHPKLSSKTGRATLLRIA